MMDGQVNPEDLQKAEIANKTVLRKILSRSALERLARVKLVKPEAAEQLELYLVQLYQSGKVRGEVSEAQMKSILETISGPADRKIKIVRK